MSDLNISFLIEFDNGNATPRPVTLSFKARKLLFVVVVVVSVGIILVELEAIVLLCD